MFENLVDILGLDWELIVTGMPLVIFLTNALKDLMELKGKKQVLTVVVGLSLMVGFLGSLPDVLASFANSLVLFGMSIGGWSGAKRLAHKVGAK